MSAAPSYPFPLLLHTLYRFETESLSSPNRRALVRLFCLQILPFLLEQPSLEPLWKRLREQYEELNIQAADFEKSAIQEIKKAFREVQRDLKRERGLPEDLKKRMEDSRLVILKDEFRSIQYPLFRIYDDEFRNLLQALLKAGYRKVCEKHAELVELDERPPKDPSQPEKWALLNDRWEIVKIVPGDLISEEDKQDRNKYYCLEPEMRWIKVPHIRTFQFAPSTSKTFDAQKAIHWNQLQNPAVVWRYLECALLLWNTPSSDFENEPMSLTDADEIILFHRKSSEYSSWKEINRAKDTDMKKDDDVLIFTEKLFKDGFKTLISTVAGFLSREPQYESPVAVPDLHFELLWHSQQLWLAVETDELKERFCIQTFKCSGFKGGSDTEQFSKKLVENPLDPSPRQIDFERVSHALNRCKLPKSLKKKYFGPTWGGSHILFQGPKIKVSRDEVNLKLLLSELKEIHKSNGDFCFIKCE